MALLEFDLADDEDIVITIDPASFKDRKGNPATIDGVGEWSCDNTDVLALTPAGDGLSCSFSAVGPFGDVNIFWKADGRSGPDTRELVGLAVCHVNKPGDAVEVQLVAGTPTKQP